MTPRELAAVRAASEVNFVVRDRTFSIRDPGHVAVDSVAPPPQPAQSLSNGVKRIGTLQSPTARIDGVDDRFDVGIAIVDTGIDSKHPDLDVRGGVDCAPGKGWQDSSYHGTMVGGFAAAIDNAIGRVGVAPGAKLWSVRVFSGLSEGQDSDLICGIDWITKHSDQIKVANLSLGGPGADDGNCGYSAGGVLQDPVHAAICASVAKGITYVVSAGNESIDVMDVSPANYEEVITVSAIADGDGQPGGLSGQLNCVPEQDDTFAFFSNFGSDVDVAAPGACISSTYPGGQYAVDSGTSYAAPLVSGAAALFIKSHPKASPAQIKGALIARWEPGPIPEDPDVFPEGIINVAGL